MTKFEAKTLRVSRGRGPDRGHEIKAEAKAETKFLPRGQSGLETLTSLLEEGRVGLTHSSETAGYTKSSQREATIKHQRVPCADIEIGGGNRGVGGSVGVSWMSSVNACRRAVVVIDFSLFRWSRPVVPGVTSFSVLGVSKSAMSCQASHPFHKPGLVGPVMTAETVKTLSVRRKD